MQRTTSICYKKYIPESSPSPYFIQGEKTDKMYSAQDVVQSLQKRIEAILADPNVSGLSVSISLEEECHEMIIVDSDK